MIKYILLLLLTTNVYSHDLWSVKNGNDWILASSTECAVTTFNDEIFFVDETPKPIKGLIFNNTPLLASQKLECEKLMAVAGNSVAKTLKAVPSSNGTRRTRDITATTYTSTRIPDTSLCEGAIVKKYQRNKNWHKVQDMNLTTLCGEY